MAGVEDTKAYSQFNGLVPVDDIAWQNEWLDVDNMDVSTLSTNIQPTALERQMTVCDSAMARQTQHMTHERGWAKLQGEAPQSVLTEEMRLGRSATNVNPITAPPISSQLH